jgi:hypothetical protein
MSIRDSTLVEVTSEAKELGGHGAVHWRDTFADKSKIVSQSVVIQSAYMLSCFLDIPLTICMCIYWFETCTGD